MRISADGYINLQDQLRVRTPGSYDQTVEPLPETEALSFLLSHSFRGHRRIVRALTIAERKRMRMATWADSVTERMALMHRVWRAITESAPSPATPGQAELIQVVQFEHWAYPIYLDGDYTRVIPLGGVSVTEIPEGILLRLDGLVSV